ncbi:hypothetical protein K439DRAFT_1624762 [Ramaria rubella]|nr:hypothetical protein K439DRAFT_1624762 [Ramaria rubella]
MSISHQMPLRAKIYYVTGKYCIGANKWFTTSNNRPFRIQFPAHINSLYKDSKISSYGNNTDIGKIDLKVLKKLKMIFTLDPVTNRPNHISNKAPFVMDTLHYIQQTYDNTLNHINSEAIFENILFSSSGSPVKLDKLSIGSSLSTKNSPLASMSSHAFCAKTPPLSTSDLTLAHLPNPSNRFSSIHSIAANVKLTLPNIRENNGVLISLLLCNTKLCHGHLVDVTITCHMWHICGDTGIPNGSHAYQFVLHKMQLIPTMTDSAQTLLNFSSCSPALHTDIVDGQASDQSHSTVTTSSVILECLDDSTNSDISTSNVNNTEPSTTTSTPSTSSLSYYKVAAGKKRPASNTGKMGNIPKTPELGKTRIFRLAWGSVC